MNLCNSCCHVSKEDLAAMVSPINMSLIFSYFQLRLLDIPSFDLCERCRLTSSESPDTYDVYFHLLINAAVLLLVEVH